MALQQYGRVRLAAYAVTVVWSLVVLVVGVQLDGMLAKLLSFLPLLVVAAFATFDTFIWRWGPVQRLVQHPNLNGTWQGKLVSIRDGAEGPDTQHDPIPVFIVIWQTYLTLSISLLSAESRSRSICTVLEKRNRGDFTVHYHYGNVPELTVRDRSPIHAGGSRLDVGGLTPDGLSGEYWTDRKTRGTYKVHKASDEQYADWEQATRALGSPEG